MAATPKELQSFLAEIRGASETARTGHPGDLDRVRKLVGAMGQSFTTTVFAFQQASALKDSAHFIAAMAEKYPNEPWVATVASEMLRRPVNTLKTRYALTDTAAIHEQASKIAAGLNGRELLDLARRLIEYHGFLVRRIRDLLPFHELGIAFEGHKVVSERAKFSPKGKGAD